MFSRTDPEVLVDTHPRQEQPLPLLGDWCLVQIAPITSSLGIRYLLKNTPLVLGREDSCEIQIFDRTVSRRHAAIERQGQDFLVVDLNSSNGTFVNHQRIVRHRLREGDNLSLGNAIFRFLNSESLEALYHEEIHRLAILDPLTEIPNHRYLREVMNREVHRSFRYQRPLALLILDIDHFKQINEQLGHLGGDAALRQFVSCVQPHLRVESLFARYAGDEFVVLLPETQVEEGLQVAERLRQKVEEYPFKFGETNFSLTLSIGVAGMEGDKTVSSEELIQLADTGLFQAKQRGRNFVFLGADNRD